MAKKARLRVVLCRGCCCGTHQAQDPDFDHRAQARSLTGAVAQNPNAELKTVDCLNHCSRANIIVVSGARSTRRPTWLGDMVEPQATKELCDWIASGGDDDLPELVAAHQMDPREPEDSTRHRKLR
jgi:predicted metal-binding protein